MESGLYTIVQRFVVKLGGGGSSRMSGILPVWDRNIGFERSPSTHSNCEAWQVGIESTEDKHAVHERDTAICEFGDRAGADKGQRAEVDVQGAFGMWLAEERRHAIVCLVFDDHHQLRFASLLFCTRSLLQSFSRRPDAVITNRSANLAHYWEYTLSSVSKISLGRRVLWVRVWRRWNATDAPRQRIRQLQTQAGLGKEPASLEFQYGSAPISSCWRRYRLPDVKYALWIPMTTMAEHV